MSRDGLHVMDSIVQDCEVKPEHRALYDVRPGCDLVIRNANKHHGGSYVCSDVHGDASEDVLLSVLGNYSHKLVDEKLSCCTETALQGGSVLARQSVVHFMHVIFI